MTLSLRNLGMNIIIVGQSLVPLTQESILRLRIQNLLDTHGILTLNQRGFRAAYSTSSYMLELLSLIEYNVKAHVFTAGIFVDLQKAFDSIQIKGSNAQNLTQFTQSRGIRTKVNDAIE